MLGEDFVKDELSKKHMEFWIKSSMEKKKFYGSTELGGKTCKMC